LLVLALILAGCGGGGNSKWQQVQGSGFRFQAPAAWTVSGSAASLGPIDRVQVNVFRLQRPYSHKRLAAAAKELDNVANDLAGQLKGKVTSRRTLRVDGLDARGYAIDHNNLTEEITFALRGRHEYELLCRRAVGGDDSACRELVAGFRAG
jgi:hypothetical protein